MKKILYKTSAEEEPISESDDKSIGSISYVAETRTVYIRGEIEDNDGIDFDLVVKTLIFKEDGAKDYSPINVVINSGGGSVKAGLNIVSQMNYYQRLGVRFHTLCEEIAYSMAFLIFISGDFRSMRKYASIMFHFGYRLIPEEYILSLAEIKRIMKEVRDEKINFTEIVVAHTGISAKKIDNIFKYDYDYYLNANEALQMKCTDVIV